jgi:hypothetical protein
MKRVFLGGSRKVSRLDDRIRARLEDIVRRELQVLVGDANGADRAMQRQLADWGYRNVLVYFVGSRPRNNEGSWETRNVPTPPGARGFAFYSVKDRAMAESAECGLMLWDGESRGTLANVRTLAEAGKPVAVYVAPSRRFVNVLSVADLAALAPGLPAAVDEAPPESFAGLQTAFDLAAPEHPARRTRRNAA